VQLEILSFVGRGKGTERATEDHRGLRVLPVLV
jgi:hypothetical protein